MLLDPVTHNTAYFSSQHSRQQERVLREHAVEPALQPGAAALDGSLVPPRWQQGEDVLGGHVSSFKMVEQESNYFREGLVPVLIGTVSVARSQTVREVLPAVRG